MTDIVTRPPVESVRREMIDRNVYTSEELYQRERERVLARTWQLVCHESEIPEPGDYVSRDIAGQSVFVVRDTLSTLRAFYNSCSHRGVEIAPDDRGHCSKFFKCMYHGWTYDFEGRCVGVPYPAAYGDGFRREDQGLTPIALDSFMGLVFVSLDPKVPSLIDFLGESTPHIETLCAGRESIGRVQFEFEGNWKLWHDNFGDNYHPEFSHRVVRDLTGHYGDQGANEELDFGHGILRWPSPKMDLENYAAGLKAETGWEINLLENPSWSWVPHAEPKPGIEDIVLVVFPNLSVESFYGGEIVLVQAVTPESVGTSVVRTICLGDTAESPEHRAQRLWTAGTQIGSWGKVAADDTEAMVRAQRGLGRSRTHVNMQRGRAPGKKGATRDEYSMRSFYQAWYDYMGDAAS